MPKITKEQQRALLAVFRRCELFDMNGNRISYLRFRRSAQKAFGLDCIMVRWCGMWLGIEKDGYTHS